MRVHRRELRRTPDGHWFRAPVGRDDTVQGYVFLLPGGIPSSGFRLKYHELHYGWYCRKYQTRFWRRGPHCRYEHRCAHCAGQHPAEDCDILQRSRAEREHQQRGGGTLWSLCA